MNYERLESIAAVSRLVSEQLDAVPENRGICPGREDLERLIEVAFFATLHEEETRRTEFDLAWVPNVEVGARVVTMGAAVVLTPKNLAKLAPATRREASSIAVRRDGDALVGWALVQYDPASALPLTIHGLAPGVLRIANRGVPIALYARGEILVESSASPVKSAARRLTSAFAAWKSGADARTGIDPRAAIVTRMASLALGHGHGGMILVVPAGDPAPLGIRVHYEAGDGANMLSNRYAEFTRAHGKAKQELLDAIDMVARLTAVDNAVLLDTDLRLRGFGVQVIEGDVPRTEFLHVSPYSDETHTDDVATYKGTRHPAGVLFCLRQPAEAASIIASQDGRLSLVVKDPVQNVEVLGSYELGFGWR
jgi:hypothetical protein